MFGLAALATISRVNRRLRKGRDIALYRLFQDRRRGPQGPHMSISSFKDHGSDRSSGGGEGGERRKRGLATLQNQVNTV